MVRDFIIPGEAMVSVKGNVNTIFPVLTQLGLAEQEVNVKFTLSHDDIHVNAWGGDRQEGSPAEIQYMGATADIDMHLIHYDNAILQACIQEAMGGGASFGQMGRAGQRMGTNAPRFSAGNHFIGLNILSPVAGLPFRFLYAYLTRQPATFPMGVKKSVVVLTWRAICATNDPWGGGSQQPNTVAGTGLLGANLFDRVLDT